MVNTHRAMLAALLIDIQSIERLSSTRDVERIDAIIDQVLAHLPGPVTPEKLCRLDHSIYTDWDAIAENEYSSILTELIRLFDSQWPISLPARKTTSINGNIIRLFCIDHSASYIMEATSVLFSPEANSKLETIVYIIEACIKSDTWLTAAFVDLSYHSHCCDAAFESIERKQHFIQLLISTPNRIANYFRGESLELFMPQTYSCALLSPLVEAIHFISKRNALELEPIFSTMFLSRIFSRILIDFNFNRTSQILPIVVRIFSCWCCDENYRATIQSLLRNLNKDAIEVIAFYVLQVYNVDDILGENVVASPDWKFVLQTKFTIMNHWPDERMIKNLVRYLARRVSDTDLHQILIDILRVWSSKTSIKSQSIKQHIHLTRFIIVATEFFGTTNSLTRSNEVKLIIHNGVQNHMESLNGSLRAIGMITAEIVLNKLNASSSECELKFNYDSFSDEDQQLVVSLRDLSVPRELDVEINVDSIESLMAEMSDIVQNIGPTKALENIPKISVNPIEVVNLSMTTISHPQNVESLDSDDEDDLQPYSLANDKPVTEDKSPRYLIDLRDALLESDDANIFEKCLENCTQLITERLPQNNSDIGLDILRLLIGLEQKFYMDKFEECRFSGCVAVCTVYPKECAEYLCAEFHTQVGRYSISKKVLMLDILAEAARTLSKLQKQDQNAAMTNTLKSDQKSVRKLSQANDDNNRIAEAKRIISERIEKKTRRFASRTKSTYQNEQLNRFASVAGHFFFPLIYGYGKEQFAVSTANNTLKHDVDNILLTSLLSTLATITLCAQNCPILTKILPEVFAISTVVRYHTEPKVRFSTLQMIAAAMMAAPVHVLQLHFYNHLTEIRAWLEQCLSLNIVKGEKDAECREMSMHVLALCVHILNTERD